MNGLLGRQRVRPVLQSEDNECGLACLAMIAQYHGSHVEMSALRGRYGTSMLGVLVPRLLQIADAMGLASRALLDESSNLDAIELPAILHWDLAHFVVVTKVTRSYVVVCNPQSGFQKLSFKEFKTHYTGIAIELWPQANFQKEPKRKSVPWAQLVGRVSGLKRSALQLAGLSFCIEVVNLALPAQLQWVVDDVLVSKDVGLLTVVAIAFAVLVVLQSALSVMRGVLISWLGQAMSAQWSTNLFAHLLRLPVSFFSKRSMGDLLNRFQSVRIVQTTITGSFIEALIDGVMGFCALGVLALYNRGFALLGIGAFAVYALLRVVSYSSLHRLNQEQLAYDARQSSSLLESLSGIEAIKLANKESDRANRMQNAYVAVAQREMRRQRIAMVFPALSQGVFGMQRVGLLTYGASLCLQGRASAGMLLAGVAYADQFTTRMASLVDKCVEFAVLRVHRDRIAEVALEAPEERPFTLLAGAAAEARIEFRDVSFQYASGEPWILRNLSLTIEPGESIAIVGPSGCGKTTLARLLLGLHVPTTGEIWVNGQPMVRMGFANYRQIVSAVMQDDTLFTGSLADNISFFDQSASVDAIERAARAAAIHDDIVDLPLGYETRVGDMGSALSGGQKQRVVLARALFRQPRLLVLDEATSHVDVSCEKAINEAVRGLNCTRIIIAHRPETIASAGRVVELRSGGHASQPVALPAASSRKRRGECRRKTDFELAR